MKTKVFLLVIGGLFFVIHASAQTADHVVISQIQTDSVAGAGGTEDDWVELYNPTSNAVDLTDWSIQKTSATGGSLYRKALTGTIPAYGYFLIVRNHADTTQSLKDSADVLAAGSSFSLADNNTVYLVSNNEDITGSGDADIVDMVGMGTAQNFEGTGVDNPADGGSIERKPGSGQGNGTDTDNNQADFFQQSTAHPRNSASPTEVPAEEVEEEPAPPPSGGGGGGFALEINEILPNPDGKDSGAEWIELRNGSGGGDFDLSGWYLDDEGEADTPGSSAYQLPNSTIIPALDYLAATIPKGRFALNNAAGDAVRLFDAEKNLRLRQPYPGPAKSGFSYAKDSSNQWQWTQTPTPGAVNEFVELTTYSTSLRISEVLPNPRGDDLEGEFIELYNFGSDSVNLTDWMVADARKRYQLNEEEVFDLDLGPGEYFVLWREVSRIVLNNSGLEEVSLFAPTGELVHKISFDAKGREEQSYAWAGAEAYQWTSGITPGAENRIFPVDGDEEASQLEELEPSLGESLEPAETEPGIESVEMAEIRSLPLGSLVDTAGVVVAEPGILGENIIYLAGSGIQVLLEELPEQKLKVGQKIQVIGELASFHNELRLKVNGLTDLDFLGENEVVEPHQAGTGEIGEALEGFLVRVSGAVTRSSGDTFFVNDGSGEARILIKESTGIEKPFTRKGTELTIVGAVTQYNDVYRILPRYQDDITLSAVAGERSLPRTGADFWLILALIMLVCYSIIVIFIINRKEINYEQS